MLQALFVSSLAICPSGLRPEPLQASSLSVPFWEEVGGREKEVIPQVEKHWCCGTGESGGEGV